MATLFEIPALRTGRLLLRAFHAGDHNEMAVMQAKHAVRRHLGDGTTMTREQTSTVMERFLGQWALRGYGLFAVEADGRCAGWAGILHPLEWPEPELAYALDEPFWGRGLAAEAARAARDWAFATHNMDRLASFIRPENVQSIRVAQKLGAEREGTLTLRGAAAEWWVHRK